MTDEIQTALPPNEPPAGAEASWKQDVWSARAAGKIDGLAWPRYEAAYNRIGESLASAPPQAPQLSQQQAQTQLDALRTQYIEGKIPHHEFMSQMSTLGPLAAGEQPGAPQPTLTIDQQLQAQISEQMAPAQAHEYEFSYPIGHELTEAEMAVDSEVRGLFADIGVPKHLGMPIFGAIDQMDLQLHEASPETRSARERETTETLKQQWGDDFFIKRDAILMQLDALENYPRLAERIDAKPWTLADARIWLWLDSIIQHRAGKHI